MRFERSAATSFREPSGLTILEVLVALSVIAVAFLALAMSQITNVKATVRTQSITDLKAAANIVLEERMAAVLEAEIVAQTPDPEPSEDQYDVKDVYKDSADNEITRYLKFWFLDYYYVCSGQEASYDGLRPLRPDDTNCAPADPEVFDSIEVNWEYVGRTGILGEGLLDIIVTATHDSGAELTIGDVISCYDVYPSPSSEVPMPCPTPAAGSAGGST